METGLYTGRSRQRLWDFRGFSKGLVSVEGGHMGSRGQYRDMTSLHVSEDLRGHGAGRQLFLLAKDWARDHGAEKLYISLPFGGGDPEVL